MGLERNRQQEDADFRSGLPGDAPFGSPKPEFLLYVEPPIRGLPGQDVAVTGWVLAPEPIKEIAVRLGDRTEFARFGLFRADVVRALPGHEAAANAGFSCIIPSANLAADGATVTVTVRTRGGMEHFAEVPFGPGALAGNPAGSAMSEPMENDGAAMHLTVDQVAVDRAGLLKINGWAIAHSRVETVEIYVNDERVGTAQYGLERDDVAHAWPGYANSSDSGFALVTDGSRFPDAMQVVIRARAFGGIQREITVPFRRKEPARARTIQERHELTCDEAVLTAGGDLYLSGWAVSSVRIDEIRVVFEGDVIGCADFGRERPDVGNKFPDLPQSRQSGFFFKASVERQKLRTEHVLALDVVVADGEVKRFNVAVALTEAAPEASIAEATAATEKILCFVDDPLIVNGTAAQEIRNGLSVVGWALANGGVDRVDVELDGAYIGQAFYGLRREDIAAAFPNMPENLLSGFAFSLPRRALSEGAHAVGVIARGRTGDARRIDFKITAAAGEEQDGPWSLRRKMPAAERLVAEKLAGKLAPTCFEIWLHGSSTPLKQVRATLQSLEQQVWSDWRIVVHGRHVQKAEMTALIQNEFTHLAEKIILPPGQDSKQPWRGSAAAWIMPIEAGDVLACDALLEFALRAANGGVDFLYADERRTNPASQRTEAFFKPGWSPDLLLSANYIGRPWCARAEVFRKAKLSAAPKYRGQYDCVLRCTEQANLVERVPKVLCERAPLGETPASEMQALARTSKRRSCDSVVSPGRVRDTYRLRPRRPPEGLVSIIIPTCGARGLVKTCVESIRARSTYRNFEIICVDNIFDEQSEWKSWLRENSDVVVEILEPFNWSQFNNIAAEEATGSYLLFLNDDIEVIQPDWLEVLLEQASRPEIGVVGPQLLYPDRKVQHAGLFLAGQGLARHAFRFCQEDDPGYFGLALTQRNVIGVTGACMLVRKDVFEQLGRFEEAHAVVNNDLDFCLKACAAGYWNIYSPFATLIHHELASRHSLKDVHNVEAFNTTWAQVYVAGDPFFHPNLSRNHDNYQYEPEPTKVVYAGHPLYLTKEVKRILAIKVDHIGDFLTAFPAFQKLKQHFPTARLYVLAAPAARQLARLEPSIDELIPFEYFHARSGARTEGAR